MYTKSAGLLAGYSYINLLCGYTPAPSIRPHVHILFINDC